MLITLLSYFSLSIYKRHAFLCCSKTVSSTSKKNNNKQTKESQVFVSVLNHLLHIPEPSFSSSQKAPFAKFHYDWLLKRYCWTLSSCSYGQCVQLTSEPMDSRGKETCQSSAIHRINRTISARPKHMPSLIFPITSIADSFISREKSIGLTTHSCSRPWKLLKQKQNKKAKHFAIAHNTGLYGVLYFFKGRTVRTMFGNLKVCQTLNLETKYSSSNSPN